MGKRGRDDEEGGAVAELFVKPETVCSLVLQQARQLRDKCNSLYDIESKMYVSKDNIVLKVGFFDELQCSQILDLAALVLPGNYIIREMTCDIKKQVVVFTLTKSSKLARVDAEAGSKKGSHTTGGGDADFLRLRTVHDVKEGDAPSVMAALRAVTAHFESPGDWRLLRCAHRPAMYVLYIELVDTLPGGSIRAAAEHKGVVDFDNKQLVVTVDKKQSDIY